MSVRSLGPFDALGYVFALEVTGGPDVDLTSIFGPMAIGDTEKSPDDVFHLTFGGEHGGRLERDGVLLAEGRTRILLQVLITRLGQAVVARADGCAVHATTLQIGDRAVMIAGASGRGKSTLAARLLLGGGSLIAEDISVIAPEDSRVRPYPRPLGLADQAFEALGIEIPGGAGEPCGCGGKVLASAPQLGAALGPAARPDVVAIVDRNDDVLVPLTPAAAMARLLTVGVVPLVDPVEDLTTLAQVLAGARSVALGSSDLAAAVDWIAQLASGRAVEPVLTHVQRRGSAVDVYLGTEAVVVEDGQCHLLNPFSAAVLMLDGDGLQPSETTRELGTPLRQVEQVLQRLTRS